MFFCGVKQYNGFSEGVEGHDKVPVTVLNSSIPKSPINCPFIGNVDARLISNGQMVDV